MEIFRRFLNIGLREKANLKFMLTLFTSYHMLELLKKAAYSLIVCLILTNACHATTTKYLNRLEELKAEENLPPQKKLHETLKAHFLWMKERSVVYKSANRKNESYIPFINSLDQVEKKILELEQALSKPDVNWKATAPIIERYNLLDASIAKSKNLLLAIFPFNLYPSTRKNLQNPHS